MNPDAITTESIKNSDLDITTQVLRVPSEEITPFLFAFLGQVHNPLRASREAWNNAMQSEAWTKRVPRLRSRRFFQCDFVAVNHSVLDNPDKYVKMFDINLPDGEPVKQRSVVCPAIPYKEDRSKDFKIGALYVSKVDMTGNSTLCLNIDGYGMFDVQYPQLGEATDLVKWIIEWAESVMWRVSSKVLANLIKKYIKRVGDFDVKGCAPFPSSQLVVTSNDNNAFVTLMSLKGLGVYQNHVPMKIGFHIDDITGFCWKSEAFRSVIHRRILKLLTKQADMITQIKGVKYKKFQTYSGWGVTAFQRNDQFDSFDLLVNLSGHEGKVGSLDITMENTSLKYTVKDNRDSVLDEFLFSDSRGGTISSFCNAFFRSRAIDFGVLAALGLTPAAEADLAEKAGQNAKLIGEIREDLVLLLKALGYNEERSIIVADHIITRSDEKPAEYINYSLRRTDAMLKMHGEVLFKTQKDLESIVQHNHNFICNMLMPRSVD